MGKEKNWEDFFEIVTEIDKAEKEFHDAVINHEEPICPKCHIGRIVCPSGKIEKPHFFVVQMIVGGI